MYCRVVCWVLSLVFVASESYPCAADDTLDKVKSDYHAIQPEIDDKQVIALSRRCVQIVEVAKSSDDALDAIAFIQHLSTQRPLTDIARNLAVAIESSAERFDAESIGKWQPVFGFLWYNMRRPPADISHQEQIEVANGLRDYLEALYDEATSPYLQAIALYAKIENRLVYEREIGVLSDSEREEALNDVKVLIERHGFLKKPHKRNLKWELPFEDYANGQFVELGKLHVGAVAPDIDGNDLSGRPLTLSEYRGRVVLISFWGAWCGPCLAAIPDERKLVERLDGKPFAIVGVNTDSDVETAKEAKIKHQITWRSFWNGPTGWEGNIAADWFVQGYPLYYVLDREGRICFKSRQYEGVEKVVDKLLEGPATLRK